MLFGAREDRSITALWSKVGAVGAGMGGEWRREALSFPGRPSADWLLDIRLRENLPAITQPVTSSARTLWPGRCLGVRWGLHIKTRPPARAKLNSFCNCPGFLFVSPLWEHRKPCFPNPEISASGRKGYCLSRVPGLWTNSTACFVNAPQKQTNSDLSCKWHVWKIMNRSI
jgi:hypothetical protein